MELDRGNHTLTFFVVDSHTDGVAAGMLIDNLTVTEIPKPEILFRRGDSNSDGRVGISDAVFILLGLFTAAPGAQCERSADTDSSEVLDVTDAVFLLNFLFLGGPAPGQPFPTCGLAPTTPENALSCESFEGCEEA